MSLQNKAFGISQGQVPDPKIGARSLALILDFTQGQNVGLNQQIDPSLNGLDTVQTIFIDNSNSNTATIINLQGVNEKIVAPPYSQGFFPILFTGLNLIAACQSGGNVLVPIQLINVQLQLQIWSVTTPGAIQGTVAVSGTVITAPKPGAFTDRSGQVASAGVSQLLVGANGSRQRMLIQNPGSANGQFPGAGTTIETLYINFTNAAGVDNGTSIELQPGGTFDTTETVSTEAIYVTAATAGHHFIAKEIAS